MDQILSKLKNNSTLCLKAVVTATNYNWTFEKVSFTFTRRISKK